MGANRNYLAVELAADGDRAAVIAAVEDDSRMHYDTDHNDTLVFDGPGTIGGVVDRLERVVDSVARAVLVHHVSSTMTCTGYYYERRGSELRECDRIGSGYVQQPLFDYIAREYDIHAAL